MKVVTLSLLGGMLLTACVSDEYVAQDYVIYDLGGSNQSLIGADGMIEIENVTAFRLAEPFIFVEAGGRYDNGRTLQQPCSYHLIDMRNQRKISPRVGSREALAYAAKMTSGAKTIMARSCLAQYAQRTAGRL